MPKQHIVANSSKTTERAIGSISCRYQTENKNVYPENQCFDTKMFNTGCLKNRFDKAFHEYSRNNPVTVKYSICLTREQPTIRFLLFVNYSTKQVLPIPYANSYTIPEFNQNLEKKTKLDYLNKDQRTRPVKNFLQQI